MPGRDGSTREIRQQWLQPAPPSTQMAAKDRRRTEEALAELERARQSQPGNEQIALVLLCDAQASSLIENVDQDPTEPGTYSNRLFQAAQHALGTNDTREVRGWHLTLMASHPDPRMLPGQYRQSGVTVGDWMPPHHSELMWRMERFHEWCDATNDPLMKAVWGHRYFETIHPFADGNGRTGRLLLTQALGGVITISRSIWRRRPEYYDLLSRGTWPEWSEWMLERITDAAEHTEQTLREPVGNPADYEDIMAIIND